MEDAYVVSEKFASETTTNTIKEVSIIVPPETHVLQLVDQIGKQTEMNEPLVEIVYDDDLTGYSAQNNPEGSGEDDGPTEELLNGKSDSIVLHSPGGEIVDIKIYVNNKQHVDKKLLKLHRDLSERTLNIKARLERNRRSKADQISAVDNLDMSFIQVGKHKSKGMEFRGVKIIYSIKIPKELREGDKMANRYGAKGLIAKVYPNNATASVSGAIDCFISPISVFGRKNLAFIKELYLGKLTKKLNDEVILKLDKGTKIDSIYKFIFDYYKLVCSERTQESIKKKLTSLTPKAFRDRVMSGELKFYTVLEPFYDISFTSIKTAAKFLDIELDEYVTIDTPDGKITTDVKVPVGITYMQALEHYSSAYASVGGAAKYSGLSKQPIKMGSGANVSSVGNLDVNAFLTYDAKNVLRELMTARSDHHKIKRELYSEIAETGKLGSLSSLELTEGGTSELKEVYMLGMGLETK